MNNLLPIFLMELNRPTVFEDKIHLVPLFVLGFLMAAALCLELRDDPPSEGVAGETSTKPAILGLAVIALTGLIGYYVTWDGALSSLVFHEMFYNDTLSRMSGLLITICALLAVLSGPDELERFKNMRGGEFCALIFASALGMILMASAANTMLMFLGLE